TRFSRDWSSDVCSSDLLSFHIHDWADDKTRTYRMARSRTLLAKAEASGAALKNPGRFKNRKAPKNTRPVGKPYAGMDEAEVRYWHELVAELPWLHSGHRVLLRVACRLAAAMDGDDFGVSKAQALSSV